MVRVGLCGFTTSMTEYFETFDVVEVQQTFYEPPHVRTLARWREQAGRRFEFTLKAWQLVTHRTTSGTYKRLRTPLSERELAGAGFFRDTSAVKRGWEATRACADVLRATAILFQCPGSFGPDPENLDAMRRFFGSIERPPGMKLLWEPRGPCWPPRANAWPEHLIRALCTELDLVHVVDPFVHGSLTPELTYWRLHGLGDHARPYRDDELARLPSLVDPSAKDVYVMFNEMPRLSDARRFLGIMNGTSLVRPSAAHPGPSRSTAAGT